MNGCKKFSGKKRHFSKEIKKSKKGNKIKNKSKSKNLNEFNISLESKKINNDENYSEKEEELPYNEGYYYRNNNEVMFVYEGEYEYVYLNKRKYIKCKLC